MVSGPSGGRLFKISRLPVLCKDHHITNAVFREQKVLRRTRHQSLTLQRNLQRDLVPKYRSIQPSSLAYRFKLLVVVLANRADKNRKSPDVYKSRLSAGNFTVPKITFLLLAVDWLLWKYPNTWKAYVVDCYKNTKCMHYCVLCHSFMVIPKTDQTRACCQ